VANKALHVTTSQIDGGGGVKGKFSCPELPCQMEQWFWFDKLPFVFMLVFHAMLKTVISKMIDC
jgi:hypothetical protein